MLVHTESHSLLLDIPDPYLVQEVIPKHRIVDIDGHNLAVRHGIEEVRVLRNMGIEAPSPILHYYNWPGRYTPYDHQRDTSAMLTLNPRAFVLNETGCVDATTEYLSPTGWRRIDQYDGGLVTQYHPKTGIAELVQPTEYVKRPCDEMIRFKTARGIDQLLSAEHRVAYIASAGGFMVKSAAHVEAAHHAAKKGWKGRFITTFRMPRTTSLPLTDEQLRLQIAVVADGHFGKHCAPKNCVMRLKKERKKIRIRELLIAAGVSYRETMPEYSGAEGFSIFRFFAPMHTKEFGAEFWAADAHQHEVVADEAWRWDGSVRKDNAVEFCSTSEASANFVQFCFAATGRTASISVSHKEGYKPLYVVHARKKAQLLYLCGTGADADNNVRREPSPDGFKYCFEVPTSFLVLRRNGCIFITGNTGKSKSALWAADYLMSLGVVHKCIIASKLSTLERVWMEEVFSTLMHRNAVVLHGTKERRTQRLAADVDFYIINHEGLAVMRKEIYARKDIDLVICDEYAEYRNHTTGKFEVLESLLRPTTRFWGMTATPCPNAPTDAYALTKLIDPSRLPQYFGTFKRATMLQVSTYKWRPRPEAYDIAYNAMQPAVRYRKADCLDLPPVVTEERTCELSPEQTKAYDRMRLDFVAEAKKGVQITAVNAADKINKLRQILCGAVRDETGAYIEFPHAPRLQVLLDCIQEAAAKVIVVVPFKGILRILEAEVSPHYTCAILNGDVTPNNRNKIITAFKTGADPHVLLCHPQVMAHGLNLTEADMCIFYAPIYSNDQFQQVVERFNRPGQTRKMTVIRIGARAVPLEWEIFKMLDGKQEDQATILDMYKRVVS